MFRGNVTLGSYTPKGKTEAQAVNNIDKTFPLN
jgi:hypothetical protein